MHIKSTFKIFPLLPLVLLLACTSPEESTSDASTEQPTESSDQTSQAVKYAKGNPPSKQGIVKSVEQSGAYSYIDVDINGQRYWLATGIIAVQPGQQVHWNDHALMNNFQSKGLNKTFDQILFLNGIQKGPKLLQANNDNQSGTVVEAINSSGYSYIHVKQNGDEVWIAAPVLNVTQGQNITWSGGSPMHNFNSRSLNRTFKTILFVNSVQVNQG